MDSYQDIRVLPDPEFTEAQLLSALFAKLHRALGVRDKGDIGVSFPEYDKTPGSVLRLHGERGALEALEAMRWRAGLNDYSAASAIQPVPASAVWRTVSRVQVKSSAGRLLRRSVRKGWLTEEEASQRLLSARDSVSRLPFIQMRSLSSGQSFRLFIGLGAVVPAPVSGTFTSYGLSAVATIPWF